MHIVFSGSLGSLRLVQSFESGVPRGPVLGVAGATHFITGHEQTQ